MSSITDKLRGLALSKEDRLLFKHGLIHESGQLTEEGKQAVLQAAFASVKSDLVNGLKQLEAEEKK